MLMNKCWCCMILSYEEFSVLFFKRSVRRGKKKALLTQSLLELWISVVAPVNQFTYFPHCHLGTMWIEIWGISTRHLITHLSQGWKKGNTQHTLQAFGRYIKTFKTEPRSSPALSNRNIIQFTLLYSRNLTW